MEKGAGEKQKNASELGGISVTKPRSGGGYGDAKARAKMSW